MDGQAQYSTPISVSQMRVTDPFWLREMELVRSEVIPYQWEALNDRVPGAAPSWWMHNMKAAARANAARRAGKTWQPGKAGLSGSFQPLPGAGEEPDPDSFYGFVFQDSDGYKWIEAVAYQLMRRPDDALRRKAEEAVAAICAAQEDSGYLDTYYTLGRRDEALTNLRDHHELYCLGHLAEAAVAWRQATGSRDLLDAACRFADYMGERLGRGEGQRRGYPGHEIAEMALVRLWEETGERRYLDLASYFVDERGQSPNYFALEEQRRSGAKEPRGAENFSYHQADKPVREQDEVHGHAVRAMYLCSGMADLARLTGDESLRAACEALWRSAVEEKRYVTGGVGGTHVGEAFSRRFDLPSDTAYSETCAAIGLAFFARRMLQMKPDARYADVMEEALYNTVLSGMALDGKSFFYVNPLSCDPAACRTDKRLEHVQPVRQKWFGCACCPPNIARLVSSLPSYAVTASADTVYLHLYVGGEVDVELNGRPLTLRVASELPWEGGVSVVVQKGAASGTIAVRIPGWCREAKASAVTLRDILSPCAEEHLTDAKAQAERDGYVYFTGDWAEGDRIELYLDMPVRVTAADPRVSETAGQVCFRRGPITYCAEGADNREPLCLWRVDAAALSAEPERIVLTEREIAGLRVTALQVPAVYLAPRGDGALYADWEPETGEAGTLTLIPYFTWVNRGENEMRVWISRV